MNHNIDREQLEILAHKYRQGTLTDSEQKLFEAWYADHNDEIAYINKDADQIKARIRSVIMQNVSGKKSFGVILVAKNRYFQVAACLLLLIGMLIYFQSNKKPSIIPNMVTNDIKPGTKNAILTLANGNKIILDDNRNGVLVKEEGLLIRRTKDGQLQYVITEKSNTSKDDYHTIETPKGGQHAVLLPDGTSIILNAASSLKYPASFANVTTRSVELVGEAYFEVAKNPNKPFIVKTQKEVIEVLGTHFNVNSYVDEVESKTTLVEGSVRVRRIKEKGAQNNDLMQTKVLKPGQQSVTSHAEFAIKTVDIDTEIAWKNGEFNFSGQNLPTIMRTISRWYNVDLKYAVKPNDKLEFEGQVARTRNLSAVLKALAESTGMNFNLKGREVTISN